MSTDRWVATPNADVGGWQVRTETGAPVAGMVLTEEYARRIAGLHNAESGGSSAIGQQTRTVAEDAARKWALRYPIPAWGLAEGERADRLAETWARVVAGMVLDALSAGGRLLPEGGETREEWIVTGDVGKRPDPFATKTNITLAAGRATLDEWRDHFVNPALWSREARIWPDGARYVGPWEAVDPEEKP